VNPFSLETIKSLALSTLNLRPRQLNDTTTLQEVGIDSLATLDLVFAVEGHFGVTIGPADMANLRCLRDLAACVDRLLGDEDYCHGA
jgi:acyl carrier protein